MVPLLSQTTQGFNLDEQLKQRLVGAGVIVSLIVVFVPMLLDEPDDSEPVEIDTRIPDMPPALQQPLPSREILPPPVPMTSIVESEQGLGSGSPRVEKEPASPEPAASSVSTNTSNAPAGDKGTGKARPTPTAWLVQVASFTHRENASRLVERLRQAQMPAQLHEAMIAGKRHYRVQMLPQLDRKDAEKLIERIKQEFDLTATLRRYSD
jgi:DedD protein